MRSNINVQQPNSNVEINIELNKISAQLNANKV